MLMSELRTPERKLAYMWMLELLTVSAILSTVFVIFNPLEGILTGSVYLVPGFFVLLGSVYTFLRYSAWGFEVRDDHLYLEYGVFTKVKTMVPFVRIQHVDTQRNALERVFGISMVVVYTAGTRGSDVKVKGLVPGEADSMQEKLRDVAIESEDRDAV